LFPIIQHTTSREQDLLRHFPVAAQSKAWVCGRSLAGIAGSNPVVSVSCDCYVLSGRGLCDRSIPSAEES